MFDGQIAVVTGAGSPAGIGYAVAEELAKHGAFVVISDLPAFEARLEGALANLRSSYPNVAMCTMDVSDAESVNAAVASIAANYGPVDILVNNAGVGGGSSEFLQLSESDFKSAFDVNFMGAVNGCRAVLPSMNERGQGAIINIASLCGLGAIPEIPVSYTASKFAVVGLTKGIALEYAGKGIRCNAICPGAINTDMRTHLFERVAEEQNISTEEARAAEDAMIAMGRGGEPSEVARAVVFLADKSASYITGVALPVAGGMAPGV